MNTKVKNIWELYNEAEMAAVKMRAALEHYDHARSDEATEEERFNEGRHGRLALDKLDEMQTALTQLRMRVQLQLDARDSVRARKLDALLGFAEELDDEDEETSREEGESS